MYPKDVPDLVTEKSNQTYPDNSSGDLNKVQPGLEGGNKRGVKPGLNIKADKTQEDWYLACEAYQTMASQDIKMKRIYFLKFSHCAAWFTGTKSEEQYFGRFIIKFDNRQLEASVVMRGRSYKYVEIEKKLIQYLDIHAHKYPQEKYGVGWIFMENKWLKFAKGSGINDFKASPFWISATLKRNKKVGINLHGAENDMKD